MRLRLASRKWDREDDILDAGFPVTLRTTDIVRKEDYLVGTLQMEGQSNNSSAHTKQEIRDREIDGVIRIQRIWWTTKIRTEVSDSEDRNQAEETGRDQQYRANDESLLSQHGIAFLHRAGAMRKRVHCACAGGIFPLTRRSCVALGAPGQSDLRMIGRIRRLQASYVSLRVEI